MKQIGAFTVAALLLLGSGVAGASVELEATLSGRPAGVGGFLGGTGAGGMIGLPLGTRTVLMTGLDVLGVHGRLDGWALSVPLQLKVYLRSPAERKVLPVFRVGLVYSRTSGAASGFGGDDFVTHDLEVDGTLGLTYFVTEHLGLGVDAGIAYARRLGVQGWEYAPGGWSVAALWRTSLVLRL